MSRRRERKGLGTRSLMQGITCYEIVTRHKTPR